MITIFNRQELLVTMDMNRQAEIRDLLASHNIEYVIKTINLQDAHLTGNKRSKTGSIGIKKEYSYEYRIFVHKRDYEKAKKILKR